MPSTDIKDLFIEACRKNELEKVKACITLGVDINLVTPDEKWAGLTAAAQEGSFKVLEHLLTFPNINVNIKTKGSNDYGKVTALHLACRREHLNIVRRLMTIPTIELNCRDKEGWNEANWAVNTSIECIQTLMCYPLINWNNKTKDDDTPLFKVISDGSYEKVSLIVSISGIDFDLKKNGETLAQIAVKKGHTNCVELLAGVDKVDWNGKGNGSIAPIMTALLEDKLEIVKILINCPTVNVNVKDKRMGH